MICWKLGTKLTLGVGVQLRTYVIRNVWTNLYISRLIFMKYLLSHTNKTN